jgi:predicted transcriptional regulator
MSAFEQARVSDAMRHGVITCQPEATLQTVARAMATNHVHSVVVTAGGDAPCGVVSERQLLLAAGRGAVNSTASSLAEDPVTVFDDAPLPNAARLMAGHGVSHVLVVNAGGRPLGVLSALDIARVLAGGPA